MLMDRYLLQIEREVILSSGDKSSKVPILQDARKRGRLGAVAPDTPPKALSAWTHAEVSSKSLQYNNSECLYVCNYFTHNYGTNLATMT